MFNSIRTALLLFSTIWSILAVPNLDSRRTKFSIPAIRKDHFAKISGASIERSYSRSKLLDGKSMLRRRQDGSVIAHNQELRAEYTSPVTVGGQTLNLLLDTGSSDFWVYSTKQPADQLQDHSYYDPTKSSTFVDFRIEFDISYVEGTTVTGDTGSDTATIGVTSVLGQVFGLADNVVLNGEDVDDGIVGLGFDGGLTIGSSTFMDNALPSLTDGLFAAYLPIGNDGAFDFGEADDSKYTGGLTYTSVNSAGGLWQFDSESYKIGDEVFNTPGLVGHPDTGSSEIFLQGPQVDNYYSFVPNSKFDPKENGFVYPCAFALPSFSFLIGPNNYATIPGANLNAGYLDHDETTCFGGIQKAQDGINDYGLPFFYTYYAVYDVSNKEFGFAPIV